MEHVPGVLPGDVAARLRVCARAHATVCASDADPGPCRRAPAARGAGAAPGTRHGRAAAGRAACPVAAASPGAGLRAAGVRHLGDGAAAAKLVRRCRSQGGARPLFPVCREQRGQSPGIAGLSAAGRARDISARSAGNAMVLWLRRPGAGHRALRHPVASPQTARHRRRAAASEHSRQPAPTSGMDGAGVRAVLAAARRHHAHHGGYRVRTAAVGSAADAVSAHLHHPRLRAAAAAYAMRSWCA